MTRILTTAAALGLSLAATAAFAHGGSRSDFQGGFRGGTQQVTTTTGLPTGLGNAGGKVPAMTDHDSGRDRMGDHHAPDRDRRDGRELAEKQRIKTELTTLETRALLLTEKVQMLKAANGNPRDIARLTEEITHLVNTIGTLQREENAPA